MLFRGRLEWSVLSSTWPTVITRNNENNVYIVPGTLSFMSMFVSYNKNVKCCFSFLNVKFLNHTCGLYTLSYVICHKEIVIPL